jgi:hypothetical protein
MRLVLKQFDENDLRTVDLIRDPQPTGVAVHVCVRLSLIDLFS